MPTNFPTSVDVFVNPTPTDSLNAPAHSTQHANANDAIEAVENYLLNGGQGLTLVKKQVIGTAVSSVTVTDAFSATYEAYKIVVIGGTATNAGSMFLRLGATTTQYYSSTPTITYSTGVQSISVGNNVANFASAGSQTTTSKNMNLDLLDPFTAAPTRYMGWFIGGAISGNTTGILNDTTSYTEFTIGPAAGTFTGGTIYVYGYGAS